MKRYGLIGMSATLVLLMGLLLVDTPKPFMPWTLLQFLKLSSGALIAIVLLAFSICCGLFTLPLYIGLQILSEQENRSRVIATNNIINSFYMVLSSILLSILFQCASVLWVCLIFFAIVIAVQLRILFRSFKVSSSKAL